MERRDGFIPLLWDATQGKLFFELSQFDSDILYFSEIAKGSGSGSVGLEWGGGGESGVIQFQRVGPKVLVVQKNTRFRAGSGGAGLEQGVDESFPDSIIASLPVVKTDGAKVIVDATPLVVRDSAGFGSGGRGGRGGTLPGGVTELAAGVSWQFDPVRSAIYLPRTKAFPKNSEVEVTVTYQALSGGARTTPESRVLSGRLHYSFGQNAHRIHASQGRYSHRRRQRPVCRLLAAARGWNRGRMDSQTSYRKEKPWSRDERAEGTDRLLSGPGRREADSFGDEGSDSSGGTNPSKAAGCKNALEIRD